MRTVAKTTKQAATPASLEKRAKRAASHPQRLANRQAKQLSPDRATLTPHESTKITGFGTAATYALLRANKLPHVKVGQRFYIPRTALMHWLEETAAAQLTKSA
jgi:excisionase family DNA binding protein